MVNIRKLRRSDISLLMRFIDVHWQKNHILSYDRALLDWQHAEEGNDTYNYLGAWDGDELLAILGYIPTRRYDASLTGNADNVVWLALWKIWSDVKISALGFRLLRSLEAIEPNAGIGVLGLNPLHLPMYKAMRYETGELSHFVLFDKDAELSLANIPKGMTRPCARAGRVILQECDGAALVQVADTLTLKERTNQLPRKSARYFANRFFSHPRYRYRVYAAVLDGSPRGLLATRAAEHNNNRALRIVDWYGDPDAVAGIGSAVQRLLQQEKAEYADFWQYGIDSTLLTAAGFIPVAPDGEIVVPTFFEPFVQANQRLHFAFRGRGPCMLVKADGDQDRPNHSADMP